MISLWLNRRRVHFPRVAGTNWGDGGTSGQERQAQEEASSPNTETLVPEGAGALLGGFAGGRAAGYWREGGQRGQKAGLNGHHRPGRSQHLQRCWG